MVYTKSSIYTKQNQHTYIFSSNKYIIMSQVSTPEYFQAFKKVKDMGSEKQLKWTGKRGKLTKKFGWTIPTESLIDYLVHESKDSKLFEIGAGNGYLAHEVKNNGGNIVSIDIEPPENTWETVYELDYRDIVPEKVSKIILPWPPANSNMAEECISYLEPNTVYFIGKENSNVTGSKKFHKLINQKYVCKEHTVLPSWTRNPSVFKKYVSK